MNLKKDFMTPDYFINLTLTHSISYKKQLIAFLYSSTCKRDMTIKFTNKYLHFFNNTFFVAAQIDIES